MTSSVLYLYWNPVNDYFKQNRSFHGLFFLILLFTVLLLIAGATQAQEQESVRYQQQGPSPNPDRLLHQRDYNFHKPSLQMRYTPVVRTRATNADNDAVTLPDTVPSPSSVLRKSMIVPGWGQVVNGQTWKVPIIYGLLAGLTYYSYMMDQYYKDYRAAYYNTHSDDMKFGPTPGHIDPNTNPQSLQFTRNSFRNRRDLSFIGIALAYGLNLVDAYVFAHMRDFDVSDDLSANFFIEQPSMNVLPDQSGSKTQLYSHQSVNKGVAVTFRLQLP